MRGYPFQKIFYQLTHVEDFSGLFLFLVGLLLLVILIGIYFLIFKGLKHFTNKKIAGILSAVILITGTVTMYHYNQDYITEAYNIIKEAGGKAPRPVKANVATRLERGEVTLGEAVRTHSWSELGKTRLTEIEKARTPEEIDAITKRMEKEPSLKVNGDEMTLLRAKAGARKWELKNADAKAKMDAERAAQEAKNDAIMAVEQPIRNALRTNKPLTETQIKYISEDSEHAESWQKFIKYHNDHFPDSQLDATGRPVKTEPTPQPAPAPESAGPAPEVTEAGPKGEIKSDNTGVSKSPAESSAPGTKQNEIENAHKYMWVRPEEVKGDSVVLDKLTERLIHAANNNAKRFDFSPAELDVLRANIDNQTPYVKSLMSDLLGAYEHIHRGKSPVLKAYLRGNQTVFRNPADGKVVFDSRWTKEDIAKWLKEHPEDTPKNYIPEETVAKESISPEQLKEDLITPPGMKEPGPTVPGKREAVVPTTEAVPKAKTTTGPGTPPPKLDVEHIPVGSANYNPRLGITSPQGKEILTLVDNYSGKTTDQFALFQDFLSRRLLSRVPSDERAAIQDVINDLGNKIRKAQGSAIEVLDSQPLPAKKTFIDSILDKLNIEPKTKVKPSSETTNTSDNTEWAPRLIPDAVPETVPTLKDRQNTVNSAIDNASSKVDSLLQKGREGIWNLIAEKVIPSSNADNVNIGRDFVRKKQIAREFNTLKNDIPSDYWGLRGEPIDLGNNWFYPLYDAQYDLISSGKVKLHDGTLVKDLRRGRGFEAPKDSEPQVSWENTRYGYEPGVAASSGPVEKTPVTNTEFFKFKQPKSEAPSLKKPTSSNNSSRANARNSGFDPWFMFRKGHMFNLGDNVNDFFGGYAGGRGLWRLPRMAIGAGTTIPAAYNASTILNQTPDALATEWQDWMHRGNPEWLQYFFDNPDLGPVIKEINRNNTNGTVLIEKPDGTLQFYSPNLTGEYNPETGNLVDETIHRYNTATTPVTKSTAEIAETPISAPETTTPDTAPPVTPAMTNPVADTETKPSTGEDVEIASAQAASLAGDNPAGAESAEAGPASGAAGAGAPAENPKAESSFLSSIVPKSFSTMPYGHSLFGTLAGGAIGAGIGGLNYILTDENELSEEEKKKRSLARAMLSSAGIGAGIGGLVGGASDFMGHKVS